MSPTIERTIHASPTKVWEVLADGWLYPLFVVGASRMREVDEAWPSEGSAIHHSVGGWPALIDDKTVVVESVPTEQLVLQARAWPFGEARVVFELEPKGSDTRVSLTEDAVSGPGAWAPGLVRKPMIGWRNLETLRRLAFIAERR